MASSSQVAAVRDFNRFYTRVIGALEAGLNRTSHTLAEARLIYEVATRRAASAADLARAMGVDPGYLSRLINKLVDAGLIALTPSASDRRQNQIALTREGGEAFATLDAASDASVSALLAPLDPAGREALVAAMTTIRSALDETAPTAPLIVRTPRPGDIGHVVSRQAVLYNADYGWDASYEGLAAEIAGKFLQDFDPACETCLIAERGGEIVGSVFLVYAEEGVGQLRLLYVEPKARGLGVGTALVAECIKFARAAGYAHVRLWTQSILTSARTIYAAAGFELTETHRHQSFGQTLEGEHWELRL